MAIYRFKVNWEENTDVERIVLIHPQQTFLDFYNILFESLELPNKNASASFFTSDDYWDKYTEITLKEEDIQSNEKLMHQTTIASLIEQPRQKFVLVYDNQLQLTFHIELIKIEPSNENKKHLPKIISAKNKIPKRRKTILKTEKQADIPISNTPNKLSDDEFDKLIYAKLMNQNITEDDILKGNIDDILNFNELSYSQQHTNMDIDPDDDEDLLNEFFDEDNDTYDDDDFNNDCYFTDDEYEN